jgi:beta-glucosidase
VADDFDLSPAELTLIKTVSDAFHQTGKKVVVVLNIGGPIEVASWRNSVDSILLAWQPGQEAGNAISDVLSGKVNPSGKLTMTFPVAYSDVPSAKSFPGKELVGKTPLLTNPFGGKPAEAVYDEGIFVGYRYYKTFGIKPAYEFGYGLSYTEFSYSDLRLSSNRFNGKLTATVSVTNSGKTAGREVVELYIGAPKGKLPKPEFELRAFAKTELLQPGQTQKLSFTINPDDLASFDPNGSSWTADAGSYTVAIGSSSETIKQSAQFQSGKDLLVEKVHKLLTPQREIQELKVTAKTN